jgi:hypothetical protein
MTRGLAIVELVRSGDWVSIQLSVGEIDVGEEWICVETGVRYRVQNFALGNTPQSWAAGHRTVQLGRVDSEHLDLGIVVGMHLARDANETR